MKTTGKKTTQGASFINKADAAVTRTTEGVLVVLLALILTDILMAVFYRYVLNNPITWSEELARYLMIWLVFIGSSIAFRESANIGFTLIRSALPPRFSRICIYTCHILSIIFMIFLLIFGVKFTLTAISQNSAAMSISMFWVYLSMPVGALLVIIQISLLLIRDFKPASVGKGV